MPFPQIRVENMIKATRNTIINTITILCAIVVAIIMMTVFLMPSALVMG